MSKNMFRRVQVVHDDSSEIVAESFTNDVGVSFRITLIDNSFHVQLTVTQPFVMSTELEDLHTDDYETAKLEAAMFISSKFESMSSYLDIVSEKLLQQFEY